MYVTQERKSDLLQRTFSWRTGFSGEHAPPHSTEVASNPPIRREGEGSLAFQKRKNSYYQRVALNLQSQPSYSGNHVITSDAGHAFHTFKCLPPSGSYESFARNIYTGEILNRRRGKYYFPIPATSWDFAFMRYPLPGTTSIFPPSQVFSNNQITNAFDGYKAVTEQSTFNNMLPDAGQFGFGETLVELAKGNLPKAIPDLARRIKKGKLLDPKGTGKDLGSDYLNLQFGIVPIVSDFYKLLTVGIAVTENILSSYNRKRGSYPHLEDISLTPYILFEDGSTASDTNFRLSGTVSSNINMSAKFIKLRNDKLSDDAEIAFDLLQKLGFNQRLTWDLMPWSWFIDWFTGMGNSIENAITLNGSNKRFSTAYASSTVKTNYISLGSPGSFERKGQVYSGWQTIERGTVPGFFATSTYRTMGSPLGFGLNPRNFSPYQWSILVSLGLAKIK